MKFFRILYKRGKNRLTVVYEAPTKRDALKQFKSESLGVLLNINECTEPLSMKWDKLMGKRKNPIKNKRVRQEPYIAFLDQLATMLEAGMPINTCLAQCVGDTKDKAISAIFTEILSDIESGQSLTQSASRFEVQLTNLSLSMFSLGEQTGTLAKAIEQLATILQQIHENRMKFKKATRYPLFIIFVMILAFGAVITFIVPKFESFFRESGLELPYPTRFLLWVEYALRQYGIFIIVGAFIIAFFLGYMYKNSEKWKWNTDRLLLRVYIVGKVTYYAMIGRFTYLFEVLVEAGIPMLDAIEIAQGVVDNSYIKSRLYEIPGAIEEGRTLTQGFKDSEQFESMVIQMIQAGESSGSLGKMLSKVNRLYNNRYNYIIDNVATMIEPILIAAIAGFVLVLALGIFLPMWSMTDLAG